MHDFPPKLLINSISVYAYVLLQHPNPRLSGSEAKWKPAEYNKWDLKLLSTHLITANPLIPPPPTPVQDFLKKHSHFFEYFLQLLEDLCPSDFHIFGMFLVLDFQDLPSFYSCSSSEWNTIHPVYISGFTIWKNLNNV